MLEANFKPSVHGGLIHPILVILKPLVARAHDKCCDDGHRQAGAYEDQYQFHGPVLSQPESTPTPATDGLCQSAEMAADRSILAGKSADLPYLQGSAMMDLSEKEDPSWMNSVALRQARPTTVASAFLSLPLSLFWFCFTRSLQADRPVQQLTRPLSVSPKKLHQCWKKPHLPSLSHPRPATKTQATHLGAVKGGRSFVSAFGLHGVHRLCTACVQVVTPNKPTRFEVRPC